MTTTNNSMKYSWEADFNNKVFYTMGYIPFIILAAYFTKKIVYSLWAMLTPGYQWFEVWYLTFGIIGITTIVYVGQWLLDSMEKGISKIQQEREEFLVKIAALESENAEMRSIFKRAIQFSEDDKKRFNQ